MKRAVEIIEFLKETQSEWYKVGEVEIICHKSHFKKGEMITIEEKKFVVLEDKVHLRVMRYDKTDLPRKGVPLTALFQQ
ncbi:hypothetical protein E4665_02345 [Sporolactobacillus shoreae]|uniref:Uncharacterized protein n=1 Tax=Sporolactobacillus shoreae TaxID=1465501 RepID=A0A4Z0GU62_9BACL|nr:hypothetical protein [Sporolactobacillus shoreae]TGA99808.1 hypothetical protein E4665_02345 [Sporolactobacillus shoreae]